MDSVRNAVGRSAGRRSAVGISASVCFIINFELGFSLILWKNAVSNVGSFDNWMPLFVKLSARMDVCSLRMPHKWFLKLLKPLLPTLKCSLLLFPPASLFGLNWFLRVMFIFEILAACLTPLLTPEMCSHVFFLIAPGS